MNTANIGNLIVDTMPLTAAPIQPIQPIEPQRQVYTNPELEMISKEIEELAKERRQLESELVQKEADIRIKNGEVRNLQSELDTLVATLKQLENQKGEAQKRLNDLKAQVCGLLIVYFKHLFPYRVCVCDGQAFVMFNNYKKFEECAVTVEY